MEEPGWERSLVDRLVADARPVRRLWRPEARLVVWLALAAGGARRPGRAGSARADLALRLRAPAFLLEQSLLLLGCGAARAGGAARRRARPSHGRLRRHGRDRRRSGWRSLLMLRAPVHHAWTIETFLEVGRPCLWRCRRLGRGALGRSCSLALRRGAPLARRRAGDPGGRGHVGRSSARRCGCAARPTSCCTWACSTPCRWSAARSRPRCSGPPALARWRAT